MDVYLCFIVLCLYLVGIRAILTLENTLTLWFLYLSNNFEEYHRVFKSVVEKLCCVEGVMIPCLFIFVVSVMWFMHMSFSFIWRYSYKYHNLGLPNFHCYTFKLYHPIFLKFIIYRRASSYFFLQTVLTYLCPNVIVGMMDRETFLMLPLVHFFRRKQLEVALHISVCPAWSGVLLCNLL